MPNVTELLAHFTVANDVSLSIGRDEHRAFPAPMRFDRASARWESLRDHMRLEIKHLQVATDATWSLIYRSPT